MDQAVIWTQVGDGFVSIVEINTIPQQKKEPTMKTYSG